MKRDVLSAAYIRGYAVRTGRTILPVELCSRALMELTEEELDIIHAAGRALN